MYDDVVSLQMIFRDEMVRLTSKFFFFKSIILQYQRIHMQYYFFNFDGSKELQN